MYKDELINNIKEYTEIFIETFCHNCKVCEESDNCMLQKLANGECNLFGTPTLPNNKYDLFVSNIEYDCMTKDELKQLCILSKEFGFEIVFTEKYNCGKLVLFLNNLENQLKNIKGADTSQGKCSL